MFGFGSMFFVLCSLFGVREANAGTEPEPEHEPRSENMEA
jgi:hypothetical protein